MTIIILVIWLVGVVVPFIYSTEEEIHYPWIIWIMASMLWIIPTFTGVHIKNNEGQYNGYVTAVEMNGAIFTGYNVFLKTDLTSSNEDKACINRNDKELIKKLKEIQEKKESVVLEYEGVLQYAIGECPSSNWMIIRIK